MFHKHDNASKNAFSSKSLSYSNQISIIYNFISTVKCHFSQPRSYRGFVVVYCDQPYCNQFFIEKSPKMYEIVCFPLFRKIQITRLLDTSWNPSSQGYCNKNSAEVAGWRFTNYDLAERVSLFFVT